MNRINKLNHFTTFSAIKPIIENGMKFSTNFRGWEDQNDAKLIEIYKEITHNDNVGVICFLNDDETIYHWTYFAKQNQKKEVCCIELAKKELLEDYLYHSLYRCQEIQYDVLKEVSFDNAEELLFTKRHPYRNEREYRIVSLNGGYLPVKNYIQKITLSPFLTTGEFEEKKSELRSYGLTCEINHSTVLENTHWIFQAKLLKEKSKSLMVDTRLYENLHNDDVEQILDFVQQHEKAEQWSSFSKNSYITRVLKNDKLIGLVRTRIRVIDVQDISASTKCLLTKDCTLVCKGHRQNEIDFIAIDCINNKLEFYNLMIKSLLNTMCDDSILVDEEIFDDTLKESLETMGLTTTCKNNGVYIYSSINKSK